MTDEQINNVVALAGLLAIARVRRALVQRGYGAPAETPANVAARVARADRELREYLESLKTAG